VTSADPDIPFSSQAGERFTPLGSNFHLDQIEIAVSIAEGATFSQNQLDGLKLERVSYGAR
jgi:hypothetical protein